MTNKEIAEAVVRAFYRGETPKDMKTTNGTMYVKNGVLYSYGRHFPLAFMEAGKLVINSTKYSQTTGKHRGQMIRAANENGMADEIELRAM